MIPIIDIIYGHNPKSVNELSILLNANGYFGRYKILESTNKNNSKTKIKVEVNLLKSDFIYQWPYNNYYILGVGFDRKLAEFCN